MIGVLAGDSSHVLAWSHLRHPNSSFPPNAQSRSPYNASKWCVKNLPNTATVFYLLLVSLPGLRAPIYMVSGVTRRVSYTRFVLIDFCAAIISVPIWVYLGEFGAKNLDWLHEQIQKGQLVIYILIGVLALYLFWKWKKAKKSKAN